MKSIKRSFVLLASVMVTAVLAADKKAPGHVKASLVSEVKNIQPGQTVTVGLHLKMDKGWHTYWKNAGESGAPTTITWGVPLGFKVGPIQWPYPHVIAVPPVVSYGYSDEVLLLVDVTAPASLPLNKSFTLKARADWLECADVCIPGGADVNLSLYSSKSPKPDDTWAPRFSEWRSRLPITFADWKIHAVTDKKKFQIQVTPAGRESAGLKNLYFYPEENKVIDYAAKQDFQKRHGRYSLTLTRSEASEQLPALLKGILVTSDGWRGPDSEKALSIDTPLALGALAAPWRSFWLYLLFAFLGGVLLNLMPCVLPVLSLKVLGIIEQSQGEQQEIIKHSVSFTLGVLVSFIALAGVLLFLRAGGDQLGWGFQLQSPRFVVALTALFFLMGLNLFGVFEIGTSLIRFGGVTSGKTGALNSFLSGVLATIVATPCTAPFMGTALGFALTQPPAASFAIFGTMGLGLSFPYILLGVNPSFVRFLPKPGAWMEGFKQFMGFLLMATAVWLLWVYGRQTSVDSLIGLIASLLVIGMGAWILGWWGQDLTSKKRQAVGSLLASLLFLFGLGGALYQAKSAPREKTTAIANNLTWEPYDTKRLNEWRRQGRPVFVDFTAAWCLTCQVNERVVLNTEVLAKKFEEKNVALMKADWTSRDDKITQALAEFGRSGVPVYVLYAPTEEPKLLPTLLTTPIVLQELEKIK